MSVILFYAASGGLYGCRKFFLSYFCRKIAQIPKMTDSTNRSDPIAHLQRYKELLQKEYRYDLAQSEEEMSKLSGSGG